MNCDRVLNGDDRSEDATILLGLEGSGNRERLVDAFDDGYDLCEGTDPDDVDATVDLWLVDPPTLERRREAVLEHKRRATPVFLPVLLVFPSDRVAALDPAVWEVIDGIVGTPTSPAALAANVENVLRTRALSKEVFDSRQRFESLVQTTASAILFLRPDGTIEFANAAAETMFGYEEEELLGAEITLLIPPELQDDAMGGIERFGEEPVEASDGTLESTARHRDGHEIPIQIAYGWFERDGEVYLTGIVTDTTRIRERETRLEVLNRVLRHDVRNDMNLIKGHAETAAEQRDGESVHLETIRSVASDVVRLSEQARTLDELIGEAGSPTRAIDVSALVQAKCHQFGTAHHEATITSSFPDGTDVWVEAIELIESAVDNLIENAIEHHDGAEPSVEVTVAESDDEPGWATVEIADDGPGMPPEDVRVIETNAESALEHASGLGLWLVNWIVRESEGRIEFAENDPRGSRITLFFRRAEAEG